MSATDPLSETVAAPAGHPHPAPPRGGAAWDVLVVGGGHAGVEAAAAAGRLGARTALVTPRLDRIGEMSCNPAIGGLGKGQLTREIDALGGLMARAIDATGIQFRLLNAAKGQAVQAPRAQADRHLYREEVTRLLAAQDGVELVEGSAEELLLEEAGGAPRVRGIALGDGRQLSTSSVVLTTGTFLSAIMHVGEQRDAGGRFGEASSEGLSGQLRALGLKTGRLKTGTPARLYADSLELDDLEPQPGDPRPQPFSFATDPARDFPRLPQVACHITWTNPRTHDLIRDSIHLSPMYAGRIEGVGPRYCPSVEDKVVRFADRERHQIFLEPEGLSTDLVYPNGISTSLPAAVQEAFIHTIAGLERARLARPGYAVEYDFVQPWQLDPSLALRAVAGLYLAGQINGTSGYEEAGGQGLMAGANAALWVADRAPFTLGREQAYLGVLVDDLVLSSPSEPYRMFSSRAEYRLLLRQDNADRRLTARAAELGLASPAARARLAQRERRIGEALALLQSARSPAHGHKTLAEILRRPEVSLEDLERDFPAVAALHLDDHLRTNVEADVVYAGYLPRAQREIERLRRQEAVPIPPDFDFSGLSGLRNEAREKLATLRPRTLGAAGRIAGINPPDVALLAVHLERTRRRSGA